MRISEEKVWKRSRTQFDRERVPTSPNLVVTSVILNPSSVRRSAISSAVASTSCNCTVSVPTCACIRAACKPAQPGRLPPPSLRHAVLLLVKPLFALPTACCRQIGRERQLRRSETSGEREWNPSKLLQGGNSFRAAPWHRWWRRSGLRNAPDNAPPCTPSMQERTAIRRVSCEYILAARPVGLVWVVSGQHIKTANCASKRACSLARSDVSTPLLSPSLSSPCRSPAAAARPWFVRGTA